MKKKMIKQGSFLTAVFSILGLTFWFLAIWVDGYFLQSFLTGVLSFFIAGGFSSAVDRLRRKK